jgi:uncharacterized damage-inducible protein DinB
MLKLFLYNHQVRNEYFALLEPCSTAQLMAPRTGGLGSIAQTLHHIVEVEYGWLQDLMGNMNFDLPEFEHCSELEAIREFSDWAWAELEPWVRNFTLEMESNLLDLTQEENHAAPYTFGEVMRHVIAHEIHHAGQLSVWVRELGLKPPSASVIRRGLG